MKKNYSCKFVPALLAVIMVIGIIGLFPTIAYADSGTIIYPGQEVPQFCQQYAQYQSNQALYPYSHTGTVVCRKLTVRTSPSTSASSYGRISNGKTVVIVGKQDGWLIVDLASCGFAEYQSGYGYVKENLIKEDPYWIVVPQYINLYATPWQNANLKNGEQDQRVYLVIEENSPFYAVQCCEDSAGTAFIYMQDVVQCSQEGQSLHVCAEKDVPLYDAPWGDQHQIGALDKFTIVNVNYQSGDYYYITVVLDVSVSGWVKTQYIQRIIN